MGAPDTAALEALRDERDETPNPGSDAAIAIGCRCPVIDNGHGRGWMGQPGIFVFNCDCPVHICDEARHD